LRGRAGDRGVAVGERPPLEGRQAVKIIQRVEVAPRRADLIQPIERVGVAVGISRP
jgi:hypothetical protein